MVSQRFANLLHALRDLRLPVGDFAIFGSGPLAVRGIIDEPNDLDVVCRGDAWGKVHALGDETVLEPYDVTVVSLLGGRLTFGTRWAIGVVDVDTLIDNADVFDGLPYAPLDFVIAYKRERDDPKDREHLQALAARGHAVDK